MTGYAKDDRLGFVWQNLNRTTIGVNRMPEDQTSPYTNVRIWKTPMRLFLPIVRK